MLFKCISRLTSFVYLVGVVVFCTLLGVHHTVRLQHSWSMPFGTLSFEFDSLSNFFSLLICFLSAVCALYSGPYLSRYKDKKSLGSYWLFFNILTLSMIAVVAARNAILFLMAWELMALSSFFLVTFEHEDESVSNAGWIYLVATQMGTLFILIFFIVLGNNTGSFDFDAFHAALLPPSLKTFLFLCALVGFGTKIGLIPVHVWLPQAHPAAPSPVSALMSGVMIKTGLYGLIRTCMILENPPVSWGYVLICIGIVSGVGGIASSVGERDIKKLLAYSSVENMGIITIGLGMGMVGLSMNLPGLQATGFLGAFLHMINHCLFKSLLFLGAGSVVQATHTKDMDKLGGLLKKMPWTASTFLIGAIAISGLPPLNGFISEFLIYFGAFKWGLSAPTHLALFSILIILALVMIGGLAIACFTKLFGTIFLGSPRSTTESDVQDPSRSMCVSMGLLAASCIGIGLFPALILKPLMRILQDVFQFEGVSSYAEIILHSISMISLVTLFLILLVLLLWALRYIFFSNRPISSSVTWACGYSHPTPRMQYTSSSFVQSITSLFNFWVGKRILPQVVGYFPSPTSFTFKSIDFFREWLYDPLFQGVAQSLSHLRRFQYGRIQLYIFYIMLTLIILLIWQMRILS